MIFFENYYYIKSPNYTYMLYLLSCMGYQAIAVSLIILYISICYPAISLK